MIVVGILPNDLVSPDVLEVFGWRIFGSHPGLGHGF